MAAVDHKPEHRCELEDIGGGIDCVITSNAAVIRLGRHPETWANYFPIGCHAFFWQQRMHVAQSIVTQHPSITDDKNVLWLDVAMDSTSVKLGETLREPPKLRGKNFWRNL